MFGFVRWFRPFEQIENPISYEKSRINNFNKIEPIGVHPNNKQLSQESPSIRFIVELSRLPSESYAGRERYYPNGIETEDIKKSCIYEEQIHEFDIEREFRKGAMSKSLHVD